MEKYYCFTVTCVILPDCSQPFWYLCTAAAAAAKSFQSCPSLCDSMDGSPLGPPVHGIFQARVLEWIAISFSRGSSRPKDGTWVSCIVGRCFYCLSHQWRWNKLNKSITKKCKFSLSLYIYTYIYTHTHIYTHIYIYIHTHTFMCTYMHILIYISMNEETISILLK